VITARIAAWVYGDKYAVAGGANIGLTVGMTGETRPAMLTITDPDTHEELGAIERGPVQQYTVIAVEERLAIVRLTPLDDGDWGERWIGAPVVFGADGD
jgi:hypothetical protein